MKILMLAPHPFYQARGTPIAADLVIRVLSKRGDHVDLITFPEGSDVRYPNVTIHRTRALNSLQNIRPGFSLKKIVCDAFMVIKAFKLAKKGSYDVIHAGEEAVFIALLLQKLLGIPYVYDMDSSLANQLIDKSPKLRFLQPFFQGCEKLAVRNATAIIAVCQALADEIKSYHPKKVAIIPDISLLRAPKPAITSVTPPVQSSSQPPSQPPKENFRQSLGIEGTLLMYVGNLESYQGIDLLLASFASARPNAPGANLVIIGGNPNDIEKYEAQAVQLNAQSNVHLVGPKPIADLQHYLNQADIVVSPRIQGDNTPMKLYSYLDSGKALLATNLTTHTQVLNEQIAYLCEPNQEAFAEGIAHLVSQPELRKTLGEAGQAYILKEHTYEVFSHKLTTLYDWIQTDLSADSAPLSIA